MDAKPYHIIEELYKLFEQREGKLSDKEIGYFTGQIKALLDLYYEPPPEGEIEKRTFKFMDIKKNILGE